MADWPLLNSVDYFSPAITKIQQYAGVDTRTILRSIGRLLGEKVASMTPSSTLENFMKELSRLWKDWKIGRLSIESVVPLVFYTNDCVVCGQLSETGDIFRCTFHEGFFEAAISSKIGRQVKIRQETALRGGAGTWSRRYFVE